MKQEFESYLRDNLMQYSEVTPYVYKIGDNTFELYKPDNDGALFDDDFRFTGLPMNPDRYNQRETTIDTSADYYAYKFGGCWYMLPKDSRNAVKLVRLKYLGTAAQEVQPTNFFLGVHGQYEILSGSGTYTDWCRKAKFLGVQALGICEKDTLAGVLKFQAECLTYGLKPIIGMECSVYDVAADYKFTVKVYVKNADGWQVMLSLNKEVNCINAKYVELERFKELVSGQYENLLLVLDPKTLDYGQCLRVGLKGLDIVYYQLDPVRYNDEKRDKSYLLNLKAFYADKELAPVMMCDAWYLDKEYSSVRDRLSSISGSNFYSSDDQYFKSNDQLFVDVLGILPHDEDKADAVIQEMEQSLEAMQGEIDSIDFTVETGKRHLPRYIMTPEESARYASNEDMFWGLIADGLETHPELIRDYGEDVVMARIDTEVDVIKYGDTVDYFLITRDIINWCHQNGIMTGVSRGSAGGCLISYLLGITKLNPLEYGLLFERFLNKGRIQKSLPDIDSDYPGVDRPRVKKYMEERFGAVQVCSVGTFSALQLRAAIKDLSRVYGLEFQDVNEMMKLFSVDDRKPEDLFQIACSQPRVKKFVKTHSDLINEVLLVMPAPKAQSIHACATMIFPREHDMFHWVPIRRQGDEYVTEWEGGEMDVAGFLKNDILGVKQLDKFQDMVALIRQNRGEDVNIFNIPLDDPEVFRYFQNGWNEDNFHFGSRGLTGYCKQMRPQNITELIAAISLYRPGAMENGFHESYLKRRAGIEEISYYVGTEDILKETYGIFCYQEEIMELCKKLGGLSLIEADDVRKAMVKKKYEALHKYHERFTPYYMEHFGVTHDYAESVWEAIDKASTYLFNKSHAAAYAITGYISQYMKVHYPIEYWSVAFKYATTDDYSRYIAEINKTGVCKVHPVDINISDTGVVIDFEHQALYWSIMGVKQVAERAAEQIIKERCENGQYWSLTDFISRHKWKGSAVNSRVIQNLILAGAFDAIENLQTPAARVELLQNFLQAAKIKSKDDDPVVAGARQHQGDSWWWHLLQKQVSGLAFFDYQRIYDDYFVPEQDKSFRDTFAFTMFEDCIDPENIPNAGQVFVGGYVSEVEYKKTKNGKMLCRVVLEQNYEFMELVIFDSDVDRLTQEIGELTALKGNIIFANVSVYYDKRKEANALRVNYDTHFTVFQL